MNRPLSPRELEILHLMTEGRTNPEIAVLLCIDLGTVKTHVKHIFRKLAVDRRTKAIVLFLKEEATG